MYDYPIPDANLHELFSPDLPNSPALWAVLRGNYSGHALVDDSQNPTQCVLRTDASLTYFNRDTSQEFLEQAIVQFRHLDKSLFLVWPHLTERRPPEFEPIQIIQRVEFFGCDPDSHILRQFKSQLPDGFHIQRIDQTLFDRCAWRANMIYYAGSASNFLQHGLGVCMLKGEQIVTEAYASSFGLTRAEIGAFTHLAFRGNGFAPIACATLIELCALRGYQPYWSCESGNLASRRVAQKLGFQRQRDYQIYGYNG